MSASNWHLLFPHAGFSQDLAERDLLVSKFPHQHPQQPVFLGPRPGKKLPGPDRVFLQFRIRAERGHRGPHPSAIDQINDVDMYLRPENLRFTHENLPRI